MNRKDATDSAGEWAELEAELDTQSVCGTPGNRCYVGLRLVSKLKEMETRLNAQRSTDKKKPGE